jgi:uncharacterized protein YdhG (YjbR/CyaY superfamily)
MMKQETSVADYIAGQEPETQRRLILLQHLVKEIFPRAEELISYGMPAYKQNGKPLVYFAGYKNHIGLYALPNTHKIFAKALKQYKQGKGSVRFPLDEPLPLELIKEMLLFRKNEQEKLNKTTTK